MSLEPVIALVTGLLVLGQVPTATAVVGIVLVVVASIGAERSSGPAEARPDHSPSLQEAGGRGPLG